MVDAGPEPTYEEKIRVTPPLYPLTTNECTTGTLIRLDICSNKIVIKIFCVLSGMNYLHREAPIKVIHRDLKSKNGNIFVCVFMLLTVKKWRGHIALDCLSVHLIIQSVHHTKSRWVWPGNATITAHRPTHAGDKNISILHLSCRTSDLQFSFVLQTHALVL